MTQPQKDYLTELLNKEAAMDNNPLKLKKQALNKAILGINEKMNELNEKRTALIVKRDIIVAVIAEREATATALADVIVVEI